MPVINGSVHVQCSPRCYPYKPLGFFILIISRQLLTAIARAFSWREELPKYYVSIPAAKSQKKAKLETSEV
ncbi:hypothetical protein HD806DRAFT_506909, partial [Xylariaceae sp. AK1471]